MSPEVVYYGCNEFVGCAFSDNGVQFGTGLSGAGFLTTVVIPGLLSGDSVRALPSLSISGIVDSCGSFSGPPPRKRVLAISSNQLRQLAPRFAPTSSRRTSRVPMYDFSL